MGGFGASGFSLAADDGLTTDGQTMNTDARLHSSLDYKSPVDFENQLN
jgi:hypothetical protein